MPCLANRRDLSKCACMRGFLLRTLEALRCNCHCACQLLGAHTTAQLQNLEVIIGGKQGSVDFASFELPNNEDTRGMVWHQRNIWHQDGDTQKPKYMKVKEVSLKRRERVGCQKSRGRVGRELKRKEQTSLFEM